jgi:isopentenyl-diphosphate Delta-isomerase
METEKVILVDMSDNPVGEAGKMEAHQAGSLHRAFSVFIFNDKGEMLLQQRALNKYHSGGLWTNACCSHPSPGEETMDAVQRRLMEELGITVNVEKIFDFLYKAGFDNGLTEHEFDHVFVGRYDGKIDFNRAEVMDICYKTPDEISESLQSHPQKYSAWFRIAFPLLENWRKDRLNYRLV